MNLKKSIVTFSLLLLGLTFFTACESEPIENESLELIDTQSTDKGDAGTIGNSGGDDDDDDYN